MSRAPAARMASEPVSPPAGPLRPPARVPPLSARRGRGDLPYEFGEFWTARQRQAERIHEISYRSCFKPQLPAWFIDRYSRPGDVVYDPFMGRGTTPIEAALRGRVPWGADIAPLCAALAEPRVNPPPLRAIADRLDRIPFREFAKSEVAREDLLAFYHPRTLARIEGLRRWLLERALDKTDRWIRMVAINRLTGHSPGFFSVWTMPPNQAVTAERQEVINRRRGQTPPERDVAALILRKSKSLLSQRAPKAAGALFLRRPADSTPEIPDDSVALTVTSPPFLDIVNYEQDNWLRCWFLGVDPKSAPIARHRNVADWTRFVRSAFAELARITRPGGHVAFEVGEVRNGSVWLEEHVVASVEALPFRVRRVLINEQRFTKTSNTWGISNNRRGTNTNRIVLMERMR